MSIKQTPGSGGIEARPDAAVGGALRRVLVLGAGLAVIGFIAAGAAWHLQGGRWFVVATPSMGQQLPVGTLVITRPATVAEVGVRDIVTFVSPGSQSTFTHRVVGKERAGLETRGDINAVADAWRVTDDELVGIVVWEAPALGLVARALPPLVIAMSLLWLATRRLASTRRYASRSIGGSVVVALLSWWLSPWVGIAKLGQRQPPNGEHGVLMDVVVTGLLPIRVLEQGGPAYADLVSGQTGSLHLTAGGAGGAYDVTSQLDLPWWGWALLVLFCFAPLLWNLTIGLPPSETDAAPERSDPAQRDDSGFSTYPAGAHCSPGDAISHRSGKS